jgi:DNA-binding NarL/FixJ family response regulator
MSALKILIADDHDIVREGLRVLIQKHKEWEVCAEAVTGREAVEKAKETRPDIVLMDFSMPELNGLDATRQIRKLMPQTEVLILTMHDSEQLVRELLEAGARGYLVKTDAARHLVPAVLSLADHKPYFASKVSNLLLDAFLRPGSRPASARVTGDRLTPREREIVQLVAEGKSSKEIAATLNIALKTVNAHRANIMNKLDLHSLGELVLYAVRNRLVQP